MILLLAFIPESFSETELKTVTIFVEPPTGLSVDDDLKNDDEKPKDFLGKLLDGQRKNIEKVSKDKD